MFRLLHIPTSLYVYEMVMSTRARFNMIDNITFSSSDDVRAYLNEYAIFISVGNYVVFFRNDVAGQHIKDEIDSFEIVSVDGL